MEATGHPPDGAGGASAPLSRRGEAVGVAALVVLTAGVATALTSRSYFFFDDYLFLDLGRRSALDWSYLSRSAFGHLIPSFMLGNDLLGRQDPVRFRDAAAVLVLLQVACAVAAWRLARALVGRSWLPLAGMAVVGTSLVMLNAALWWSGGLCLLPSTAGNLAAMAAATTWDRLRRARDLVLVGLAYLVAMTFWEKSLLVAVYTVVLLVVVVDSGLPLRDRWRRFWGRLPLWLVFAAIGGAYALVYVRGDYVSEAAGTPTAGQMARFLGLSAFEGLFPSVAGIRYPHVEVLGQAWLGWVLPAAAVLALVAWSSLRAARARAAWLFFAVVYLVNQGVLGYGRIGYGGIHIGREYRYQLDNLVFFVIAAVVAVHAALGARPHRAVHAPERRSRPALAAGVAVLLLVPGWLASADQIVEESPGPDAREYLEAVDASLRAVRAAGDDRPILSSVVPEWIVSDGFYPFNRQDVVVPIVRSGVPFSTATSDGLVIDLVGALRPAAFVPVASRSFSPPVCIEPGRTAVAVELLAGDLHRAAWFVQVRFAGEVEGTATITLDTPSGPRDLLGTGGVLEVRGAELFASGITTEVSAVGVLVEAADGACVTSVAIGGV